MATCRSPRADSRKNRALSGGIESTDAKVRTSSSASVMAWEVTEVGKGKVS
jgi:hypothetical protein